MASMPSELPRAFISHQTTGRVRLRVPEKRNQTNYFAELRERLATLTGLHQLTTNTRTASVLIEHSGDLPDLSELGARFGLFKLDAAPRATTLSEFLYDVTSKPDQRLKSLTRGKIDVAGLTVLALTGMGISQIVKGAALPAGWTLLWNAANLIKDAGGPRDPGDSSKS
jgi:hypothetical protein